MAAPPECALEGQARSREAAGGAAVDSELFAGSLSSEWAERVAQENSPSEGLCHNFPGAQLCREDGQPGTCSPSRGGSPGVLGDVKRSWCCSCYPETIVSAGLLVPGKAVGVGGGVGYCGKWVKRFKLVMQRKVQSPGHPLFCVRSGIWLSICKYRLSLHGLLVQLTLQNYRSNKLS